MLFLEEEVLDTVYDFMIKAVAIAIFAPTARYFSFNGELCSLISFYIQRLHIRVLT